MATLIKLSPKESKKKIERINVDVSNRIKKAKLYGAKSTEAFTFKDGIPVSILNG